MSDFNFKKEDLVDMEGIQRAVKDKLTADIAYSVVYQVQDATKAAILETLEPEIKALVEAQKETILEGVKEALPEIAKKIATAMVARVSTNLDGYNGRELLKKLFD